MIRALIQTLKSVYDIFASYLLIWIVGLSLLAFGINCGIDWFAATLEYDTAEQMWGVWAARTGLPRLGLRLGAMLPCYVFAFLVLRRPLRWLSPFLERIFDGTVNRFRRALRNWPATLGFIELSFSVGVTLLLVPFVYQPTLVPGWGGRAWVQRAVNLIDGTASDAIADSVVGLYRRIDAEPAVARDAKISTEDLEREIAESESDKRGSNGPIAGPRASGKHPMIDRWDPYIERAVRGDRRLFAYTKAFMYVESAGRQYAVSRTGCAGLMQFCGGTARGGVFRDIFGVGQVYTCQCEGPCRIDKPVQVALESGDVDQVTAQEDAFPCELTDARFDPDKAIRAGATYVRRLGEAYGYNPYLMYVGYNSGPAVAKRLWVALGRNGDATLADVERHLVNALEPYYYKAAPRRAKSLVRSHLPKIARQKDAYLAGEPVQ